MGKKYYLLMALLVLVQTGCSIGGASKRSEFYVLSAEPGTPVSSRVAPADTLSVGLGPITIPDIFDRPQIVTRPQANRLELSEFDRWGGDLNRDLSRVLAQNLMSRLNTDSILLHPWPSRSTPDFQVAIQIFRFDGEVGRAARLEGIWRVMDGAKGCELVAEHFIIEENTAGVSYSDFVSAMSRAIARLSQKIAEQIGTIQPGCP